MSNVFHRSNIENYPVAVKGEGVYIYDSEGNKYIDGCCGAAVSCLGHNNQNVINAIKNQIDQISYAHSGFFTTNIMEELAEYIVDRAPGDISNVYFVSGGSEAVEASIKLARQYFLEKGQINKKYVIARKQSYHGNTIGALSAGGNQFRRRQFEPLLVEMEHISPCYEYRLKQDGESSFEFGQRVANELEAKILQLGPENVISFIAEPVVGATMGCVPAVEGYFARIRQICDQYGVLLILDEIMCGMGRTGSLFACEMEKINPDIITIAKGLGGGYQPIGAMLATKEIHSAITNGSGFFQHGHTYMGHATACAASLAVQKEIQERDLLKNVVSSGQFLDELLKFNLSGLDYIGDIRGKGLFRGIEIVKNKDTKEPFNNKLKIFAKVKKQAMKNGLMCYPMGGTIDGANGDHIMLAPPFICNENNTLEIVEKLTNSIKQVIEEQILNKVTNQEISEVM